MVSVLEKVPPSVQHDLNKGRGKGNAKAISHSEQTGRQFDPGTEMGHDSGIRVSGLEDPGILPLIKLHGQFNGCGDRQSYSYYREYVLLDCVLQELFEVIRMVDIVQMNYRLEWADLVQICHPDGPTISNILFADGVLLKFSQVFTQLFAHIGKRFCLFNACWSGPHCSMGFLYALHMFGGWLPWVEWNPK